MKDQGVTFSPKINKSSKNLQRDYNTLIKWGESKNYKINFKAQSR